ncbi:hypothetical protein MRX96_035338 [Rhipicephalus microplus]
MPEAIIDGEVIEEKANVHRVQQHRVPIGALYAGALKKVATTSRLSHVLADQCRVFVRPGGGGLDVVFVGPSWSGNERRSCSVTPAWTETVTWISFQELNLLLTSRPMTTMMTWGDALHAAEAVPAEVHPGPLLVEGRLNAGGTARASGVVISPA